VPATSTSAAPVAVGEEVLATPSPPVTPPTPVKIIPKGLRSFDAHDADFFLELLPGPRDRQGLPDSLRFWKSRIEEIDPDQTFAVGLLYGPSGCGKSSLVKAGLLPRLAPSVRAVYVEATADETEARQLKGLRKACPDLPADRDLTQTLAALRRGHGLPAGQKVLLVLDQFEQWLHARRAEESPQLVQALRHCDGGRVQALVMVRDDFWLTVSRFMKGLEAPVLEGQNSALVDLFDLPHARKVLAGFGRAFGRLPDNASETTPQQQQFLDEAVAGLAQKGKVICVRLALFAEMVKGKPWTPATLKAVGGTEGVGVTFLEETFSAATAPPEHRLHQQAARAALKALLPEQGTDIKGHVRSRQELLEASGYGRHPGDFDDLLRILDRETRLVTPTDPDDSWDKRPRLSSDEEEKRGRLSHEEADASANRFYQLTHDYLGPALRAWLTRKQKETRRGRAELRLAERAALWTAKPESRHLPAWWEWANIRLLTRPKEWTASQQRLMRSAFRYHALRGTALALLLSLLLGGGLATWSQLRDQRHADHAAVLVRQLLQADTAQVPDLLQEVAEYRTRADPQLRDELAQAAPESRARLHASLALLAVDPEQAEYLYQRLLGAGPTELPVLRDALRGQRDAFVGRLWEVATNPQADADQRFRAACSLAGYDAADAADKDERWPTVAPFVADRLLVAVLKNPSHYDPLRKTLRPVREPLTKALAAVFRDPQRPESERSLATALLADYAGDRPEVLADLLMDADAKEFAVLLPAVAVSPEQALPVLQETLALTLDVRPTQEGKDQLAKRQANAAVALLRMHQAEQAWPVLQHRPDPRVRSYLVHRLGPLGADAAALVQRLDAEPDITVRRALLLSLGEFGEKDLPPEARPALLPKLQTIYRTAVDPRLHASAEWLLRTWKQEAWLQQVNDEWAEDKAQRQRRLQSIEQLITKDKEKAPLQWYVNGQGQTMVVIPGPVEFRMGSPATEAGWNADERPHQRRIGRTFAVAAKPVTVKEFRRFLRDSQLEAWFAASGQAAALMEKYSPDEEGPIILVDWWRAAAYCNWLSAREGLPPDQWCYETNARRLAHEQVSASVTLVLPHHPLGAAASTSFFLMRRQPQVTALRKGYLRLGGYRLPTEAEWEYACRAGAQTSRYYGETEELLPQYGWYNKNSGERSRPVGLKKPNDLGLFDMHGNVWSWCQESYRDYPAPNDGEPIEDKEDNLMIDPSVSRLLRGGSFNNRAVLVRSALRDRGVPAFRGDLIGFRPARTFTP
jgi:formylglycine-generating enzyme required for sulfatase activity